MSKKYEPISGAGIALQNTSAVDRKQIIEAWAKTGAIGKYEDCILFEDIAPRIQRGESNTDRPRSGATRPSPNTAVPKEKDQ